MSSIEIGVSVNRRDFSPEQISRQKLRIYWRLPARFQHLGHQNLYLIFQAPEKMESNNSSPHSSNSFTQPPNLPMSPPNQQLYDSISPFLAPPVPLEGYFENLHQQGGSEFGLNDELRASWESILGPSSISSFFNPDDAIAMEGPPFNSFPINDQLDWSELQNLFPSDISTLSPQTPLQIPGSHSSLQTGSSSSYHSIFPGVPAAEFADLKIFPTWSQVTNPMAQNIYEESVLGKRKMEDLKDVVGEVLKNQEDGKEDLVKSQEEKVKRMRVEEIPAVQEESKDADLLEPTKPSLPPKNNSASDGNMGPSPLAGKFIKAKLTFQFEEARENSLCEGSQKKISGRPPKPKQVIVQALIFGSNDSEYADPHLRSQPNPSYYFAN
ncbi:hypothetical protein BVRB_5g118200 [Beta vulgaris subsp. vulgaris]|nr:hypothetical protein BVRB_5g118200 [Beta vulgaris subsp. vulgaris]